MKYNQPVGADEDASYVTGNAGAGIQGSQVPAEAIEQPQREIINVIEGAGLDPNGAELSQLLQAIQIIAGLAGGNTGVGGFNTTRTYKTGSHVWTPPNGVTLAFGICWGAGGGGGGATGKGAAGAGGGGGGFAAGYFTPTPGSGVSIIVGQGGKGGYRTSAGQAGGLSSIGAFMSALGGTGGAGSASGVGRPIGKAGKGIGGQFNQYGGWGEPGYLSANNAYFSGNGGSAFGSTRMPGSLGGTGDGNFRASDDTTGLDTYPGQGGAGASNNGYGLTGHDGLVLLFYRNPTE
ncbi:glycine-rich domain-containing protein [Afifella sp. YEN Y35]|uniref:glycine-rich domain-containing protein n=1 Tax=Afifella sp. YEN Y35 TaxID=3388337 RepID=UPI0039E1C087